MNLLQLIARSALVHFGKGTGCAANTDERQARAGNVSDVFQLFHNELTARCQSRFARVRAGVEAFRQGNGPDRNGDGLFDLTAPYEGQFHAGTAQVEEDEILGVNRIDDAQVAQVGFPFTCNNFHGNACFSVNALEKRGAVFGVTHCRRSYSQTIVYVADVHHVLVDLETGQCPFHACIA